MTVKGERTLARLINNSVDVSSLDLAADGYMHAGWIAVSSMMARRLVDGSESSNLALFRLHHLDAEMSVAENACKIPVGLV